MRLGARLALTATVLAGAQTLAPPAFAMPPKKQPQNPAPPAPAPELGEMEGSPELIAQFLAALQAASQALGSVGAGAGAGQAPAPVPFEHWTTLGQWLEQHPGRNTLSDEDLAELCALTGLTEAQVQGWFARSVAGRTSPT